MLTGIYWLNYALELNQPQETDVAVAQSGGAEIWLLEVVEGNKNILFQYSILD